MKKSQRYQTSHLIEAQYEPGSKDRVLRNLLGIQSASEMDRIETIALKHAEDTMLRIFGPEHRFTAADICTMHKDWLGRIYEWAGHYRQVNVSKDTFSFAHAGQIGKLMNEFEKTTLREHTPCRARSHKRIAQALAEVHVELVLIHPFREGNGRISRLLSTLMALQAGLPFLDFGAVRGRRRQEYFAAVQAGLDRNYDPMRQIFEAVIERALSRR